MSAPPTSPDPHDHPPQDISESSSTAVEVGNVPLDLETMSSPSTPDPNDQPHQGTSEPSPNTVATGNGDSGQEPTSSVESWQEIRDRILQRYSDPLVNPLNTEAYGGVVRSILGEALGYAVVYLAAPWVFDELVCGLVEVCGERLSLRTIAWVKFLRYWLPYLIKAKCLFGFIRRLFRGTPDFLVMPLHHAFVTMGAPCAQQAHSSTVRRGEHVSLGQSSSVVDTTRQEQPAPIEVEVSMVQTRDPHTADSALRLASLTDVSEYDVDEPPFLAARYHERQTSGGVSETRLIEATHDLEDAIPVPFNECMNGDPDVADTIISPEAEQRFSSTPTPVALPITVETCWAEQEWLVLCVPRVTNILSTASDTPGKVFDKSQKLVTASQRALEIYELFPHEAKKEEEGEHRNSPDRLLTQYEFPHVFSAQTMNLDICLFMQKAIELVAVRGGRFVILADGYSGTGKSYTLFETRDCIAQWAGDLLFHQLHLGQVFFAATEIVHSIQDGVVNKSVTFPPAKLRSISSTRQELSAFKNRVVAYSATSAEHLQALVDWTVASRQTLPTAVNKNSSRSHLICQILIPRGAGFAMLTLADLAGAEDSSVTDHGSVSQLINQERSKFNVQLLAYARDPATTVFRTGELAKAMRTMFSQRAPLDRPAILYIPHLNQAQSTKSCSRPRLDMARDLMSAQTASEPSKPCERA
ncbi:uncharacterized protein J4E92_008620 [Alternaria infectoria]|uniref:uncharacterized protein n=1 Tax=Alternaria viburni TaxID=566460 RepID=UPI0020C213ED|nr:uncharacterized protein J4E79_000927 [Alternaria viburni]XP_051349669.1 uncharacterized protein J4E92_008620 [Alternaria infectoria]KAI4668885.1 hypothetical protein J4E79_000927 [Alternaria viburni]KAI4918976.1 hypothetical protein J4E92_008620 [Alternaria infectoria]